MSTAALSSAERVTRFRSGAHGARGAVAARRGWLASSGAAALLSEGGHGRAAAHGAGHGDAAPTTDERGEAPGSMAAPGSAALVGTSPARLVGRLSHGAPSRCGCARLAAADVLLLALGDEVRLVRARDAACLARVHLPLARDGDAVAHVVPVAGGNAHALPRRCCGALLLLATRRGKLLLLDVPWDDAGGAARAAGDESEEDESEDESDEDDQMGEDDVGALLQVPLRPVIVAQGKERPRDVDDDVPVGFFLNASQFDEDGAHVLGPHVDVTALTYLPAVGQAAVGFASGGFQLYPLTPACEPVYTLAEPDEDERAPVTHFVGLRLRHDSKGFLLVCRGSSEDDDALSARASATLLLMWGQQTAAKIVCTELARNARIVSTSVLGDYEAYDPVEQTGSVGDEDSLAVAVIFWSKRARGGGATHHVTLFDTNGDDETVDLSAVDPGKLLDARILPRSVTLPEELDTAAFDAVLLSDAEAIDVHFRSVRQQIVAALVNAGPEALVRPGGLLDECRRRRLVVVPGREYDPHAGDSEASDSEMTDVDTGTSAALRDMLNVAFTNSLTPLIVQLVTERYESGDFILPVPAPVLRWVESTVRFLGRLSVEYCSRVQRSELSLVPKMMTLAGQFNAIGSIVAALQTRDATEEGLLNLANLAGVVAAAAQHLDIVVWFAQNGLLPAPEFNLDLRTHFAALRDMRAQQADANSWRVRDMVGERVPTAHGSALFFDRMIESLGPNGAQLANGTLHDLVVGLDFDDPDVAMLPLRKLCVLFYALINVCDVAANEQARQRAESCLDAFARVFRIRPGFQNFLFAIWYLDNNADPTEACRLLTAPGTEVDWPVDIVRTFYNAGAHQEALAFFRSARCPIEDVDDAVLIIKVLMASNLVAEAFDFQRKWSANEPAWQQELIWTLFAGAEAHGELPFVFRLPLDDAEELLLVQFLRSSATQVDLLVVYFLERGRLQEALALHQELFEVGIDDPSRVRMRAKMMDHVALLLPPVQRSTLAAVADDQADVNKMDTGAFKPPPTPAAKTTRAPLSARKRVRPFAAAEATSSARDMAAGSPPPAGLHDQAIRFLRSEDAFMGPPSAVKKKTPASVRTFRGLLSASRSASKSRLSVATPSGTGFEFSRASYSARAERKTMDVDAATDADARQLSFTDDAAGSMLSPLVAPPQSPSRISTPPVAATPKSALRSSLKNTPRSALKGTPGSARRSGMKPKGVLWQDDGAATDSPATVVLGGAAGDGDEDDSMSDDGVVVLSSRRHRISTGSRAPATPDSEPAKRRLATPPGSIDRPRTRQAEPQPTPSPAAARTPASAASSRRVSFSPPRTEPEGVEEDDEDEDEDEDEDDIELVDDGDVDMDAGATTPKASFASPASMGSAPQTPRTPASESEEEDDEMLLMTPGAKTPAGKRQAARAMPSPPKETSTRTKATRTKVKQAQALGGDKPRKYSLRTRL